jgi:hypothetical protein
MNYGEGLLFNLSINLSLCQISGIWGLRNKHIH